MGMQLEILEENIYEPSFWKNIEVRYDVIYELDDTKTNILMRSFLNTLTIDELKELTYVLQITTEDNDPKKTMIGSTSIFWTHKS